MRTHIRSALLFALLYILSVLTSSVLLACDGHPRKPVDCTSTTSITGTTRTVCR